MIDGRRGRARDGGAPSALAAQMDRIELGPRLVRMGASANVLTATGVLLAAAFCVAVGRGALWLGLALLVIGGLMDALDGLVAKSAGTASARGAFFDSVADRVSDALMFGGLAWYLVGSVHPEEALLPIAILAAGSVISYERAKAESLGFIAKGGLMERTERLIALGAAIVFTGVMVPILWVTLVLTVATACGRFIRVWRQASGKPARIWVWKESASPSPGPRWAAWRQFFGTDRRIVIRVERDDADARPRLRQIFSLDRDPRERPPARTRARRATRSRRASSVAGSRDTR